MVTGTVEPTMRTVPASPPPVSLTFLAPSHRCNQRCPRCYLTTVVDEPVQRFDLAPEDYGRFVRDFLDAGIPIVATQFQGYEVTLPESWPYVEAVFRIARERDIRRGFITNGMLLHKWSQRIRALDPGRISVSLDAATAELNDRFRGLQGAFEATISSITRFLEITPEFRDRLAIASLLRGEESFRSLLGMPSLMRRLGLRRWLVSVELERRDLGLSAERIEATRPTPEILEHLSALKDAAASHDIAFHGSPEYEPEEPTAQLTEALYRRFFYRLDPAGHVLIGRGAFRTWNPDELPLWQPGVQTAPETVGYPESAARVLASLT